MWPVGLNGTPTWRTKEGQCFLYLALRRIHCLWGWKNSDLALFLLDRDGVGPGAHIPKEGPVRAIIAGPDTPT